MHGFDAKSSTRKKKRAREKRTHFKYGSRQQTIRLANVPPPATHFFPGVAAITEGRRQEDVNNFCDNNISVIVEQKRETVLPGRLLVMPFHNGGQCDLADERTNSFRSDVTE